MLKQKIYKTGELPSDIKWQVLSFLRIQWPEGFQGANRFRNWITEESLYPVSFVRMENDLLLSYAEIVWKNLEHCGVMFKTYGLTGIFTYPSFRSEGHGLSVVKAAKQYIEKQKDGDVTFFTTMTKGFYEKAGFIRMERVKTLYGDKSKPKSSPETAYMLFLSEKGKRARQHFETKPVYFGTKTW
jgi:predicted acetyltransferase